MKKIINKYFILELFLIVVLISCALSQFNGVISTAIVLVILSFVVSFFVKKKLLIDVVNEKHIVVAMIVFGVLYIGLYYMIGLYSSFYRTILFRPSSIYLYIIPISIIIVAVEYIRNKLLVDSSNLSKLLVTAICVIPDFAIFSSVYSSNDLDKFLVVVGFILFSAISNGLLFTYLSSRYGMKPIIVYRFITILYAYVFPIMPNVYMFFRTFVRIFYPLLIYYYMEQFYNTDKDVVKIKDRRKEVISMAFSTLFMILLIMLVSCKFKYGALVIGSTSMAGTIDKGDIIVYVTRNDAVENDVIVFRKGSVRVVHRVVKVEDRNVEMRYYTKGDANDTKDKEYVVGDDIIGKVLFSVKYLGRPTLWLRDLFNKEG